MLLTAVPRRPVWSCATCAREAGLLTLGLGVGLAALPAFAQEAGALRVVPSLEVSANAVDTRSSDVNYAGRNLVTEFRPGVSLTARSGMFRGSLDYALSAVRHSDERPLRGQGDNVQNSLRSALTAELVQGRVQVDASADISQQLRSAYGDLSLDGRQQNANRAEVARASIRPSFKGRLADLARYQLTLYADGTHTDESVTPYSLATGANLNLNSAAEGALLGWTANLSSQRSRFSGAQATDNERISVGLIFRPDPDLSATLLGGQETNSAKGVYRQTYNNVGGEVQWTPTPRTRAIVGLEKRYYGRSQNIVLDHRFQNSTFRFSSSQGANDTGNPNGVGQPQTLFQTYFNLPQFVAAQPDPVLREQVVRAFIRSIGQNPDALIGGGFVTNAATLQRRDDLSFTYSARRANLTIQAYRSATRFIDLANTGADRTPIEQRGVSVSASYRLTPTSGLTVNATQSRTQATATQPANDLKSGSLGWNAQMGRYAALSVTARASRSDSPLNPYRDLALGSTLSLRF